MSPSHVLVPLDGSPLADEALAQALDTYDCRVTVLNVVTPLDSGTSEGGILEPDEDRRTSARDRASRTRRSRPSGRRSTQPSATGYSPTAHIGHSEVPQVVVRVASPGA